MAFRRVLIECAKEEFSIFFVKAAFGINRTIIIVRSQEEPSKFTLEGGGSYRGFQYGGLHLLLYRNYTPEPGPRGRTKPRPATPAPKPRLTSPSAFSKNTATRKMTREWYICPAGSRTPVEQQTHMHPRRPRLVIAVRCLLCVKFGEWQLDLTWR